MVTRSILSVSISAAKSVRVDETVAEFEQLVQKQPDGVRARARGSAARIVMTRSAASFRGPVGRRRRGSSAAGVRGRVVARGGVVVFFSVSVFFNPTISWCGAGSS
jgi:hypothetical protein